MSDSLPRLTTPQVPDESRATTRGSERRGMRGYTEETGAFPPAYLSSLRRQVRASPFFTTNTLNRDFVGTRGFSVVFRRDGLGTVLERMPWLGPFLERVIQPDHDAFYANALELGPGSRVDPHVDRSLRSYCPTVEPPAVVSVLYVDVPRDLRGGELVLRRGRKHLARIRPVESTLLVFEGDLTHSVERLDAGGPRLSLVCEHYRLSPEELERVPTFAVESRARVYR